MVLLNPSYFDLFKQELGENFTFKSSSVDCQGMKFHFYGFGKKDMRG